MVCLNGKSVTLSVTIIFWGLLTTGSADVVILKDGTRIDAQRVWEDDGLVRFSLPNYEDIVITYSKEIVERIEKGQLGNDTHSKLTNERGAAGTGRIPTAESDADKPTGGVPSEKNAPADDSQSGNLEKKTSDAPVSGLDIDTSLVESVAGIQFYNARRAFKYQTGPVTKYHSFKEAVDDLAAKFGKDPDWIGKNLGDTNDLGQIYINLSRSEGDLEIEEGVAGERTGILFYDPRRSYKYWVADESKHHTLEAAISALAEQYGQTPEWIIDHLGETNDLTDIHHNLQQGISAGSDQ